MRVDELIGLLQAISDAGGGEDVVTDDYPQTLTWGVGQPLDDGPGCGLIGVNHHVESSTVRLEFDQ